MALDESHILRFDDRVDASPEISSIEAMRLLGRSFKLLKAVRLLFAGKLLFAAFAVLPPLIVPWIGKVIVDQVVLQIPFGTTDVRFPPFMNPLINFVIDMGPMEIMATIALTYVVLLLAFGTRGAGTDVVLTQGRDAATQSEAALSAGSSSAGGIWGMFEMMINVRMTQRIANTLRLRLFDRLARLEMTTLDDQRIGDSVYRVMYDAPGVPEICFKLTLAPILTILTTSISLYLMHYSYGEVAPEVVWIAAALIPLALVITAPLSKLARRVNQVSRASGAATTNSVEESVDNIDVVQSLGGMARETERFADRSEESFRRHRHVVLLDVGLYVLGLGCTTVAGAAAFILITDDVIAGAMTPGDYAALFNLFLQFGGAALGIGMYWINLQKNVAAVRRVFFFIDYASEGHTSDEGEGEGEGEKGTRHVISPPRQAVEFESVDFSYRDRRAVLSDVNLRLEIGELVAIVGPTGAGKTTLAYLLPGYLRPTAGRITFDGIDVEGADVESLRKHVTYVFQEHTLLSDSIRENLKLAKPDATDEEIIRACRLAGAMAFIKTLPDGLDTVLGRSGNTLSVGQQQRLCIARGIIRDTPILVLDEPTAALDPLTENALVAALGATARNRLVVVIAHRLSTIRKADKIVFLEEGRVRDVGTHAALMAQPDSAYRHHVELQTRSPTEFQ